MSFGKVLFTLADMIAGVLILRLLEMRGVRSPLRFTCFWLFNPLVITVSSRGNADVIVITLVRPVSTVYSRCCVLFSLPPPLQVLATVWCLLKGRRDLAAILYVDPPALSPSIFTISTPAVFCCRYALCVHFKIYPVVYSLTLVLFLETPTTVPGIAARTRSKTTAQPSPRPLPEGDRKRRLLRPIVDFATRERIRFVSASAGVTPKKLSQNTPLPPGSPLLLLACSRFIRDIFAVECRMLCTLRIRVLV